MKTWKRLLLVLLSGILLVGALSACGQQKSAAETDKPEPEETAEVTQTAEPEAETEKEPEPEEEPEEVPAEPAVEIIAAQQGEPSDFRFVLDSASDTSFAVAGIRQVNAFIQAATGVELAEVEAAESEAAAHEIIIGATQRSECAELTATLQEGEYAICTIYEEAADVKKLVVAYQGEFARMMALDRIVKEYLQEDRFVFPAGVDVRETVEESDVITTITKLTTLRDPFILQDDAGVYYVYGTGWNCYVNDSGSLEGAWSPVPGCVVVPEDCMSHKWAPEVHEYNGAYYMFTTYSDYDHGNRGCAIFKASDPKGPFELHSDGRVTPVEWDAIDGSLYVDREGQPWMVFVHEWTSMPDGIGSMCVAKLSENLTEFVSEPVEIFKARDPEWARNGVTDGCFIYEREDGGLIMLWSNWDDTGYTVAMLTNESGQVDGEWMHSETMLYSKALTGTYEGGHGMLFTDVNDGQMYLVCHSPNSEEGKRKTTPIAVPVREAYGTLVWDIWDNE